MMNGLFFDDRPDGCHNCLRWFELSVKAGELLEGECRRYAPRKFNDKGHAIFPHTFENDNCGEWQPRTLQ